MNTESIRPECLMCENARLHTEDIRTLLTKKQTFVETPCPACDSKTYRKAFRKNGFDFVTCTECDTLYISPRPTHRMLAEFYASAKSIVHWNTHIFPMSEEARRRNIFAPRAKRVMELTRKYQVTPGVLVDIGAGYGTFCEEIDTLGGFREIIAVEPSQALANTCRRKGISVVEKPIEDTDITFANVITNFELIEHLFCPREFLTACHTALQPGGLLILTTPNIQGFDLTVLGRLSDNIGGPNHLNYFNPSSLSRLLVRTGFHIEEILTPGELDAEIVRQKILDNTFDVSHRPFLRHVLIDHWDDKGAAFQQFLKDNTLSSHLWIVARKH